MPELVQLNAVPGTQRRRTALVAFTLCTLMMSPAARGAAESESLAVEQRHLQWLEDVTYIIVDRERDAFLSLTDDRSRDQFIEIFWRARDPTPGTEANEFRDEHYRRLEYANDYLGRDSAKPGWKTDRGRIYMLLGKPRSVHRFPNELGTRESELWYYDGISLPGVPPFLYVLFYKPDLASTLQLFTPGQDELKDLLTGSTQMNSTEQAAHAHLRAIDPELAHAALSMRPGESDEVNLSRTSFDALIVARIEDSPRRTVDTSYVKRLELGKEAIELEYAFTFFPMSFTARAYMHPGSGLMVDYALEILAKDLTLMGLDDKYFTAFNLLGSLIDDKKRQVATIDEQAEIHLNPKELNQVQQRPLNMHGRVVALPGNYNVSLLLKSTTTKQYARAEQELAIADPGKQPVWMSKPLLCYRVDPQVEQGSEQPKAFQFGGFRVYPRVGGAFGVSETAWVYVQLYSATLSQAKLAELTLHVEVRDSTGAAVQTRAESIRGAVLEGNAVANVALSLPMEALMPGSYELHCAVQGADGKRVTEGKTALTVVAAGIGVPWLLSREQFAADHPTMVVARARGHLAVGESEEAAKILEKVPKNAEPSAEALLLQSYLRMGLPQKVLDRFEPDLSAALYSEGKLDFEASMKCEGVADAHMQLGQWDRALLYLERIAHAEDPRPALVFKLARCHAQLGHKEEEQLLLRKACALEGTAVECKGLQAKGSP